MERKAKFLENEYYHIYSRGVEKRKIFTNESDYLRFIALLYIMNQNEAFRMENFLRDKKHNIKNIFEEKRSAPLVSILGYCLMPNHFHLILHEHTEGGISKFMAKLLTAYSMYFNTKYERSGPLFTRPFRSEHISNESQFMYIFSYLHLNPISLFQKDWKENGITNNKKAMEFLEKFEFSSYLDYLKKDRLESEILDFSSVPQYIKDISIDLITQENNFRKNAQI
ncbi:MAG: transposase [Candidatus Paceibacterota bacterium]